MIPDQVLLRDISGSVNLKSTIETRQTKKFTFWVSVKAEILVKITMFFLGSEYCHVLPIAGMPIWIVVTFLRALVAMTISIRILSCFRASCIILHVLISGEQSYIYGRKRVNLENSSLLLIHSGLYLLKFL